MVAPESIRVALDAHVVGRRGTGNETYVVNLADALTAHPDVQPIVLLDRGTPWPSQPCPEARSLRMQTRLARIPFELPVAARRVRADLLHVQYVAPPIARVPVVAAIHDLSFEDMPWLFPRSSELRLKVSVRTTARRASAVIAISEFTRSRLIDRYDLDPARVFMTPVALSTHWQPTSDETIRETTGLLGIEGPFVLAVGNTHPRKNLARLVRAVAALRARGLLDLRVVVVGQPRRHAVEVNAAIDRVAGWDWVTFTGFVDRDTLRALYGAARVVAYVSLYEGLGLPVLEALACGAVVVASGTTAVPEAAGSAAVLVDPSSDESVIDGLSRALTDESLRRELSHAGTRHAATFTMDRFAHATVDAYRAAIGTDPRTNGPRRRRRWPTLVRHG